MTTNPSVDDAISAIVDLIRNRPREIQQSGYEVYLPLVWNHYAIASDAVLAGDRHALGQVGLRFSSVFYAAAWELCRRGILRPGVRSVEAHGTSDGSAGNGYSITPMGQRWLASANPLLHIPTEPSRQAAILAGFMPKFGPGFNQRAQEAVKCYHSNAQLACCAMCGAAAESILLAVAITHRGDESAVLKDYRASGGRSRVEKRLLGQVREPEASRFHTFMDLLNYWRDDSSHGIVSALGELEAFDALSRLLRLAHFASDHWAVLTRKP